VNKQLHVEHSVTNNESNFAQLFVKFRVHVY